jgi:hypothetical protein
MPTQTFTIRRFNGVRNSVESSDATRGAMRKAEGCLITPAGALVGGPAWASLWSITGLAATIATALSGADATKVHFVTLTRGGLTFLVAWDLAAGRSRGMFYVSGTETDPTAATGSVTVAAPSGSTFRAKTAGLRWYGSRINGEVWLGNGTDANLVWRGGTLVALGPASPPADVDNPSQYAIPACKQFVQTANGVIHATGNASAPMRVWSTETPTALSTAIEGVRSLDTSFTLVLHTKATAVTAIQADGNSVRAHLNSGDIIRLSNFEQDGGGYKMVQSPTKANSSALNPNCASDSLGNVAYYLGHDLELYRDTAAVGSAYNQRDRRDTALATASSADLWNADFATTGFDDAQLLHDRSTGIVYLLAPLAAGGRGLYAYVEPGEEVGIVTGPIRYPNATDLCTVQVSRKMLAVALTADGALLTADLSAIIEQDTWAIDPYDTALGSSYAVLTSAPMPTPGIPYVGITASDTAPGIVQVLGGVSIGMANPWAQWSASGLPTPTRFFNNATVQILEFANEDFGGPTIVKEFYQARLTFQRNVRAYVGVFGESDGRRFGRWRGLVYPREEKLSGITLSGRRLTLRVIVIYFNAQNLMLRDLSVDWSPAVPN